MEITSFKQKVLLEVAKLAFEDNLHDQLAKIKYEIIKGSKAQYRCCIYKEREIVTQRVRMACGKKPLGESTKDVSVTDEVIYVIETACEECPISRFIVTENCQNCIGKKCKQACRFDAVYFDNRKANINKELCRDCGKCKEACPYNAIADLVRPCVKSCPVNAIDMDENKKAYIDYSKCISCGMCVNQCPFGAISDVSQIVDVIKLLTGNKKTYAVVAPSIEAQFQGASLGRIKTALLKIGFSGVLEAATGVDLVAWEEASMLEEYIQKQGLMLSSCCPAFVSLTNKHYPELSEGISSSLSPMMEIAKKVTEKEPDAHFVFIGPCIAKKGELKRADRIGILDNVITFEELGVMFLAKSIVVNEQIEMLEEQSSIYGKKAAVTGGIAEAVGEALKEQGANFEFSSTVCNGVSDCKKALAIAKSKSKKAAFIEGMVCNEGCIGGPCSLIGSKQSSVAIKSGIKESNTREIKDIIEKYK